LIDLIEEDHKRSEEEEEDVIIWSFDINVCQILTKHFFSSRLHWLILYDVLKHKKNIAACYTTFHPPASIRLHYSRARFIGELEKGASRARFIGELEKALRGCSSISPTDYSRTAA
jgi:hypothetical protein